MTKVLNAITNLLAASSSLAAIIGTRLYYARGPVGTTWPQVVFFDVTNTEGYQVDYDSVTVQFSAFGTNSQQSLNIIEIVKLLMKRLSGVYTVTGGTVDVNYSTIVDSGSLPQDDPKVYGHYVRYRFWYRGTNIA